MLVRRVPKQNVERCRLNQQIAVCANPRLIAVDGKRLTYERLTA
jgi:hypothetical protein